jgi:hypothetical protein
MLRIFVNPQIIIGFLWDFRILKGSSFQWGFVILNAFVIFKTW